MKKPALYSGVVRRAPASGAPAAGAVRPGAGAGQDAAGAGPPGAAAAAPAPPAAAIPAAATPATHGGRLRGFIRRHDRGLLFAGGMLVALALLLGRDHLRPTSPELTQDDIDSAVLHTLQTKTLQSRAARAAEAVLPSVVRVKALGDDAEEPGSSGEHVQGVGSGVVIVDNGIILTSLHVVAGASKISVTFADGMESEVELLRSYPENDLAVIRAKKVPDDLPAATLGSTAGLQPGDEVIAVGYPFDIGPSVSAGVVSGLDRAFRSPEGKRVLTGLIQFDAAANPGNSGGPLVTMSGEVVGIVAAILNPTPARTFIGIGFAVTIESAGAAVGIPPF